MKTSVYLFTLIVIMLTSCSQGQKTLEPPITNLSPVVVDSLPITVDNATNLIPEKRYRFQPTTLYLYGIIGDDNILSSFEWENVDVIAFNHRVVVPEGSPKVTVDFRLKPQIYYSSIDGVDVIKYVSSDPSTWNERDEIVVKIIEKIGNVSKSRKGDIRVRYDAMLLENLTHPDRKIEPYVPNK